VLLPERLRVLPRLRSQATMQTGLVVVALGAATVLAGCGGSSSGGNTQTLAVSLTDAGCSPASLEAKPGPVTFEVRNGGTGKVSELELKNEDGIILGERENIVAGIEGSFTLDLEPGRYILSCPNGDAQDDGVLLVKGKPAPGASTKADPLLDKATSAYRSYVGVQADRLLAGTRAFVTALHAGDVERAKGMFGPVRYHYEAIEPVAESFGDLDPAIDARANDVEDPSRWTGFHRIEQILWVRGTTAGTAELGDRLLRDVTTLTKRARTLRFQPAQLANGAVELLNEVSTSKITGEEDRYSHTDLSDFAGNLAGAQVAFRLLRPALVERGHADLADTIAARFADVQRRLDTYKRATPSGFASYSTVTPSDRSQFAREVGALAEPLAAVAAKISS
jgi:iron uptake system component EfeO